MEALRVEGLSKTLGGDKVVNDVSFSLTPGDVAAFAGPNGAGKSTTIKLILGLVRADAGTVHINEQPLTTSNRWVLSRVGAMIESPSFYGNASGRLNLELFADLYGAPAPGWARSWRWSVSRMPPGSGSIVIHWG